MTRIGPLLGGLSVTLSTLPDIIGFTP